jgi:hypothetical protein
MSPMLTSESMSTLAVRVMCVFQGHVPPCMRDGMDVRASQ